MAGPTPWWYRAEAFHGDAPAGRVGLGDFNAYGFDIFYHPKPAADKEIARVKPASCFDYQTRKIAPIPAAFPTRQARRACRRSCKESA